MSRERLLLLVSQDYVAAERLASKYSAQRCGGSKQKNKIKASWMTKKETPSVVCLVCSSVSQFPQKITEINQLETTLIQSINQPTNQPSNEQAQASTVFAIIILISIIYKNRQSVAVVVSMYVHAQQLYTRKEEESRAEQCATIQRTTSEQKE